MRRTTSSSVGGYGALSDRDDNDDEAGESLTGRDSYDDDTSMSPSGSRSGHFVSSPRALPTGPSHSRSGSGILGGAENRQGSGALRGWATFLRDKTAQASASMGGKGSQDKVKEAAKGIQNTASTRWQQAKEATKDNFYKMTGGPLAGLCRSEALAQPCPRAVLVCCSALVCGGLATEGLFSRSKSANPDAVHWLLGGLSTGSGVVLPAAEASPHVIAAALLQWLQTLEEPLLTYKLLPEFIAAGRGAPLKGVTLMSQLPSANQNCLQVLLEMWHRLAAHFAINGMDAHAIAQNVVPYLAWHPPPPASKQQSYMTLATDAGPQSASNVSDDDDDERQGGDEGGVFGAPGPRSDLDAAETQALISVLERMIESFTHAVGHGDKGMYQEPAF